MLEGKWKSNLQMKFGREGRRRATTQPKHGHKRKPQQGHNATKTWPQEKVAAGLQRNQNMAAREGRSRAARQPKHGRKREPQQGRNATKAWPQEKAAAGPQRNQNITARDGRSQAATQPKHGRKRRIRPGSKRVPAYCFIFDARSECRGPGVTTSLHTASYSMRDQNTEGLPPGMPPHTEATKSAYFKRDFKGKHLF